MAAALWIARAAHALLLSGRRLAVALGGTHLVISAQAMRVLTLVVLAAAASTLNAQRADSRPALSDTVPLVGQWHLNLARTHYGPGVDVR